MNDWISTDEKLPEPGVKVLIILFGVVRIGKIYIEMDDGNEIRYWDNPYDEGACWDDGDVWYWMPIPKLPEGCR